MPLLMLTQMALLETDADVDADADADAADGKGWAQRTPEASRS